MQGVPDGVKGFVGGLVFNDLFNDVKEELLHKTRILLRMDDHVEHTDYGRECRFNYLIVVRYSISKCDFCRKQWVIRRTDISTCVSEAKCDYCNKETKRVYYVPPRLRPQITQLAMFRGQFCYVNVARGMN